MMMMMMMMLAGNEDCDDCIDQTAAFTLTLAALANTAHHEMI